MLSHEIPDLPYVKIALDITEFGGKKYLIIVDYFSRWLEILKLCNKTSESVIEVLKDNFARLGIPQEIVADNMPFGSYGFRKFANEWNFKIITSSPHYVQSNGLAERGVGIAKDMLRKSKLTEVDVELFLLNYRNTPLTGLQHSPAKLLQCREVRSTILVANDKLKPKVVTNYNEISENKKRQKKWYDRSANKNNAEFCEGQAVYIQDKIKRNWSPGFIVKKLKEPRSYLVENSRGDVLRRNALWIYGLKREIYVRIENMRNVKMY